MASASRDSPDEKELVKRAHKRVHAMTDQELAVKIRVIEAARAPSNLPADRRAMRKMEAAERTLDNAAKSLRLLENSLRLDARSDLAEEAYAAGQRVKNELEKVRFDIENPTEKSDEEKKKEQDEEDRKAKEREEKLRDKPLLQNVLYDDIRGLWVLPELCGKLDFAGKGHEAQDLAKLMRTYLLWAREVAKVNQKRNPMAIHISDFAGTTIFNELWPLAANSRAWDLRFEYKTGKRPTTDPEPDPELVNQTFDPGPGQPDARPANAQPGDGAVDAERAAALARLRAHTNSAADAPGEVKVPTPEERARAAENRRRAMELRAAKAAAAAGETAAPPAADAPAPMTEEMRAQIRERRLAALAKQAARKEAEAAAASPPPTAETLPASATTVPDTMTMPDTATAGTPGTVPDTATVPASASTVPDTAVVAETGPTQLLDELLDEPLFAEPAAAARGA